MDPRLRIVTCTPLQELWTDCGPIDATRGQCLNRDEIRQLLRSGPVQFVIADLGSPLQYIPVSQCFDYWKSELSTHVADTDVFSLDSFDGGYCYVASRWRTTEGPPLVLLEKHH